MRRKILTGAQQAFSIFEVLVVISIFSILLSFSVVSVGDASRNIDLNSASETVVGAFRLARQQASTHNRPVEMRFYKYSSPDLPESEPEIRAVGLYLLPRDETRLAEPLGNVQVFPGDIIIAGNRLFSSVTHLGETGAQNRYPVAGLAPVAYTTIIFLPDGTTTAGGPRDKVFVTLWSELSALKSEELPPPNFVTIQVDSLTGGLQVYRP